MNRPDFLDRPALDLILFGGKGGVGKTTCAAAAGVHLANRHPERSYLLVSADPAHSLDDCFAGSTPPPNLHLRELEPAACFEEFKRKHRDPLQQIAVRGTFLDEQDTEQLLDLSLPGLDELMAFFEIADTVRRDDSTCTLVDTAPTGHVLRFLEMPDLMRSWLQALDAMLGKHRYMMKLYRGTYREDDTDRFLGEVAARVGRLRAVLTDTDACRFVPVTRPETVSVRETNRLLDRLSDLAIPVHSIIVNQLIPAGGDCPTCAAARRGQGRELAGLVKALLSDHDVWVLPRMGAQVEGADALSAFWDQARPAQEEPPPAAEAPAVPVQVSNPPPLPPPDLPVLMFAGKGGVGKTTLACATGLRLAELRSDRDLLLFSADPAHSLSDCLGREIGPAETEVAPGLSALEINPQAELDPLRELYIDEIRRAFSGGDGLAGIDLEFDREAMEHVMDLSPPGLDELMALLRIIDLMEDGRYDTFVLDTAPTGHLLRLLELPDLAEDWIRVMFDLLLKYKNVLKLPKVAEFLVRTSRQIKALRATLTDPRKTELNAVSIPTRMALEETWDLVAACRRMNIHVPALFLNRATPPSDCPVCGPIARAEATIREEYDRAFPDIPQAIVSRGDEPVGEERLTKLGRALYQPGPRRTGTRPARANERAPVATGDQRLGT
ncbi:MAG: ArsA family ATPase [Planctomycetota bacterium]